VTDVSLFISGKIVQGLFRQLSAIEVLIQDYQCEYVIDPPDHIGHRIDADVLYAFVADVH
jgi:hypothetical protein